MSARNPTLLRLTYGVESGENGHPGDGDEEYSEWTLAIS